MYFRKCCFDTCGSPSDKIWKVKPVSGKRNVWHAVALTNKLGLNAMRARCDRVSIFFEASMCYRTRSLLLSATAVVVRTLRCLEQLSVLVALLLSPCCIFLVPPVVSTSTYAMFDRVSRSQVPRGLKNQHFALWPQARCDVRALSSKPRALPRTTRNDRSYSTCFPWVSGQWHTV